MPTLLEIGSEIRELEDLLLEAEGDITDRESEIDAWLNRLDITKREKVDAYAGLITELESRSEIREKEAMRLSHRASVDSNKATFLKERLKSFFQVAGLKTLETDRYRVVLATHGGKLPIILNVPPDMLPLGFQRLKTELKPDMEAIRLHLEEKGPLADPEGKQLAHLGERGESIRIR